MELDRTLYEKFLNVLFTKSVNFPAQTSQNCETAVTLQQKSKYCIHRTVVL